MKKIFLIFFCLILLTGCSSKPYEFENPVDEIESIEIVFAENSLEYTVVKTLSETEKNDFIEKFQKIEFDRYIIGDPMSVYGNAVKISYQNGDYEMVCYCWADYVKNGEVYFRWKNCDEKEFNELLNSFLK
jgi:hypothetical protein